MQSPSNAQASPDVQRNLPLIHVVVVVVCSCAVVVGASVVVIACDVVVVTTSDVTDAFSPPAAIRSYKHFSTASNHRN